MQADIVHEIHNIIYEFPVLLVGINENKQIVFWNKLCEDLFDYSADEMKRANDALEKFFPSIENHHTVLDDILKFKPKDATAFEHVPVKTANGKCVYINWFIRFRKHPLLPEDITWFIGYDVTNQKIIADRLQKSEERFRTISKATNDAVWDWNLITGFLWWSSGMEQIFGYSDKKIENHIDWWLEQIHPEDRERVEKRIFDFIDRKESFWFDEYRFKRADGSYANVFDKGLLIKNEKGIPVQMIGGIMDVTDKHIFKENLLLKNAQLREYAFFNSHKLRAPLARLMSLTHLLDIDHETDAQTKELSKLILSTAQELDKLIKDVANILL